MILILFSIRFLAYRKGVRIENRVSIALKCAQITPTTGMEEVFSRPHGVYPTR